LAGAAKGLSAGHDGIGNIQPAAVISMLPRTLMSRGGAAKRVFCPYCGEQTEVAQRAMSIFCPHCRKRVILEDYKITSYYAVREFYTCGDITVEKKGHVVAPIRAGNMTIKGKVQGDISARGEVKIAKSASLKGNIEAGSLKIEEGASYDGFVRIGVPPEPEQSLHHEGLQGDQQHR
jgi:DNA-directed RNA polymerase subunit RPC12/RpoP